MTGQTTSQEAMHHLRFAKARQPRGVETRKVYKVKMFLGSGSGGVRFNRR